MPQVEEHPRTMLFAALTQCVTRVLRYRDKGSPLVLLPGRNWRMQALTYQPKRAALRDHAAAQEQGSVLTSQQAPQARSSANAPAAPLWMGTGGAASKAEGAVPLFLQTVGAANIAGESGLTSRSGNSGLNRAAGQVQADPAELEAPPIHLASQVPAGLPSATPAWTANGAIYVAPAGLFLEPRAQSRMLRHEAFHMLHQRSAPAGDAADARVVAEQSAGKVENASQSDQLFVPPGPVPRLLAFPPQARPPWDQVWIGDQFIIGEVVEGGVKARILLSYDEIGIKKAPQSQTYYCSKQDPDQVQKLAARMRKVAQQAAALNSTIVPKNYPLQTDVIVIVSQANSSFRVAGGQGVVVVKQEDTWEDVVAHEGSHSIFASHMGDRTAPASTGGLKPDTFAMAMSELFVDLEATASVPVPSGKFDPKNPPPLKDKGETVTRPAGIVMVADVLWSGSGGHPWDTVDEFFASAFGLFQRNRPLLDQIVKHYSKADAKIGPLAKRLIDLLGKVGDAKALAALKAPASSAAISEKLAAVQPTPEVIEGFDVSVDLLLNPSKLRGPDKIACPVASPPPAGAKAQQQDK